MHLLNIPEYAILSHTWDKQEVTFQDVHRLKSRSGKTQSTLGIKKILGACNQASLDDHQYIWIDTCCIDKSSSAELTEAINSMYSWYGEAQTCYAYLSDVEEAEFQQYFAESRWFSRGWTLQELIAPRDVEFYDKNWNPLGSKLDHASLISDITGVDEEVLKDDIPRFGFEPATLQSYCVAKRMSWASRRETTRIEDMAYCLLGIFKINMPLLYGEGERAFLRLQEEIIRNYDDDSILAWDLDWQTQHPLGRVHGTVADSVIGSATLSPILASSPKAFIHCQELQYPPTSDKPFAMTNMGLQIQMPLIAIYSSAGSRNIEPSDEAHGYIGLLRCSTDVPSEFLGILLWPVDHFSNSCAKFERVKIGRLEKCTTIVGPVAAAEAVQKEITIIPLSESNTVRTYCFGYRHLIIVESRELLDAGYGLLDAVVPKASFRNDLGGNLDWNTKTFTIKIKDFSHDLVRFDFESSLNSNGFSIYLRGTNATICNGISRSDSDELAIYNDLEGLDSNDKKERIVSSDLIEGDKRIQVSVTDKDVSFSQIIQVHVDLVPND